MIALEWPWALGLGPLPWVIRRLAPDRLASGAVRLPIGAELAGFAGGGRFGAGLRHPLLLAAWIALVLAAAQPVWTAPPVALPVFARDLVLAVDLSASMRERDVDPLRPDRTRLDAAREVIAEFLQRREGDRVGLVVFGSHAYLYAPLTVDRASVAVLVGDLEVGLAGDATAIGDAVAAAVKAMATSAATSRAIVLLTDGENTTGSVPTAKAAELAAAAGARVHAVGFGAPVERNVVMEMLELQGTPVVTAPLRALAHETGGRFFRARNATELADIYRELDRLEPALDGAAPLVPRRAVFHWLLAAAVALVAVANARTLRP